MPDQSTSSPPGIDFVAGPDGTIASLTGDWSVEEGIPATGDLSHRLSGVESIRFDSTGLGKWDSSLLSVVFRLVHLCRDAGVRLEPDGLPPGVQSLIRLSLAVPPMETGG